VNGPVRVPAWPGYLDPRTSEPMLQVACGRCRRWHQHRLDSVPGVGDVFDGRDDEHAYRVRIFPDPFNPLWEAAYGHVDIAHYSAHLRAASL
jgi:hypothetical protein